jgi:predicted ATP-dependent serine protease
MPLTTHSLSGKSSIASGGSGGGHDFHARAFGGGSPLIVQLQATVRFRDGNQRGCFCAHNVPSSRAKQVLRCVLALPPMRQVTEDLLRADVHRPSSGRYQDDYGLALAFAMTASLTRSRLREDLLFLGDVDLRGRVQDVSAKRVDQLNDAIDAFEVETPVRIICAPQTATWINASSTVVVLRAQTLAEATQAVWPRTELCPR